MLSSVGDPDPDTYVFGCEVSGLLSGVGDPDPWDPYVLGPPGFPSGSVSHQYGSGSGSYYHLAKIVRKTLISTVLQLLYDFLSWKTNVNVPVILNPDPDQ